MLELRRQITGEKPPLSSLRKAERAFRRQKRKGSGNVGEVDQATLEQNAMRAWLAEQHNLSLQDTLPEFQLRRVLRDERRIAILGSPGAGKTTLLQYIALTFAHERAADPKLRQRRLLKSRLGIRKWRLPVVIPLSSVASLLLAEAGGGNKRSILDVLPSTLPPDLQREGVATKYFAHHFTKGNCIILLDGLDEVPTDEEFQAVVKAIESLAVMFDTNQFLVTSRIAGWRSGIGAEFQVFYVQDLTERQTDTFIDIWYQAVERNAVVGRLTDEGIAQRAARERRAEQRATDLKTTLKENVGIRRLAVNPMLLSIIALVHRSLATLPKERGKLYAQCSKILLEQWDISRGVHVDDTNLKLEQKEAIMRRLAFAYHTGEIGEKGGGREASFTAVRGVVAGVLPSVGKQAEDADRLLERLVERSGVLTERRRGILAFSHLTFQEYFTAQYLAAGETTSHRDFLLNADRLFSDWWREVILLYAGLLSDTGNFIALLHDPSSDDLCQQRLRLAGMCIGEAAAIRDSTLRQTVGRALYVVRKQSDTAYANAIPVQEIQYLVDWCRDEDWFSHAASASVAAELRNAPVRTELTERIIRAFEDRRDIINRAAAQCVVAIPPDAISSDVVARLLAQRSSNDPNNRAAALSALAHVAANGKDLAAQQAVIDGLEEADPKVRRVAANALQTISKKLNQAITITSVERMVADKNPDSRQLAALCLPNFRFVIPRQAAALLIRLLNDEELGVRIAAAHSLNDFPEQDEIKLVVSELAARLNDASSDRARAETVAVIGTLAAALITKKVLVQIVELLNDGSDVVRESVKTAVVAFGKTQPDAVADSLLSLFTVTKRNEQALHILSYLKGAHGSPPSVDMLIDLTNSGRRKLKTAAIYALSALANSNNADRVSEQCIALIAASSADVRIAALYVLGRLFENQADTVAADAVVKALSDPVVAVRCSAAAALSGFKDAESNTAALEGIFKTLEACASNRSLWGNVNYFLLRLGYTDARQIERRGLLISLAAAIKVGSLSHSESYFKRLMAIYANHEWLLESGFFPTLSPLDLVRIPIRGWVAQSSWAWQRHLWIADGYFNQVFFADPAGHVRVVYGPYGLWEGEPEDSDNVLLRALGHWLPQNTAASHIRELLEASQVHMRLLGCLILRTAKLGSLSELQRSIINVISSKKSSLRHSALSALKCYPRSLYSDELEKSLQEQLRNDDIRTREGAWHALEGTRSPETPSLFDEDLFAPTWTFVTE